MKLKWRPFLMSVLNQIAIFALILVGIGFWQSRDLPSGKAPSAVMAGLNGPSEMIPDPKHPAITVLYFFAPWCGVCRMSMGHLGDIKHWLPDLDIRAVALDFESPDDVSEFAREVGVKVPIFLGSNQDRDNWHISAYPTYVVIGADHGIHGASIGYSTQFGMILRVLWAKVVS